MTDVVQTDTPWAPRDRDLRRASIDRDLSWLEFNRRVLQEALDERNPLLERAKFLAIFSSNLDEFFMKRMAAIRPSRDDASLDGQERRDSLLPKRELIVVDAGCSRRACYTDVLRPALAEHGIHLVNWGDLTEEQREEASEVFDTEISPVLTPLSLDAAHPFPFVSNLSTSWAFRLEDPVNGESVGVRVKVPASCRSGCACAPGSARPSASSSASTR